MLEAHFGVPAAGGILVAVNNRLSSAEVGYILRHSGARYLLLDTGLATGLAAVTGPLDLAGVTVIRCDDTGRIVEFPNSVVFDHSAGIFKQLPGTRFGCGAEQCGAVARAVANVSVQEDALDPTVIVPAVSSPVTDGAVPQADSEGA